MINKHDILYGQLNEMLRLLQELLEKAEENSSGEEQWDINFRKHTTQHTDTGSSKKKKKKVSESSKKGGSLSNLSCLSDFEVSLVCRLLYEFKLSTLMGSSGKLHNLLTVFLIFLRFIYFSDLL